MGHKKGAEVFRERVRDLSEMKIENATFYALSTENLKRSQDEVESLMKLFESQLSDIQKMSNDLQIRIKFIGDLSVFSAKLQGLMRECEDGSAYRTGLTVRLAVNYGAKAEILRAAGMSGGFEKNLYTYDAPDVDLVIRTGGEKRLSNFLLWQAAYAELYFVDTLWCDFSRQELQKALDDYTSRKRRFGV
jgi:undecaprenyl diphosphate synthase